ncbi:MAG: SPOR domain-containing protein [Gammaproteobacteria bacterium]|jgi:DedD protein|nr:SPOR domain-containing protein [Gammaproteobacteria bacterium]
MEQNIKNRLVGIIVVFALAVIFLPMILDGSGMRKEKFEIVIPPPPAVDSNAQFDSKIIELNDKADAIPELEQRFVDEVSSENQVKRTAVTDETPEEQENAAEPASAPATGMAEPARVGGTSWVLQVGSFQDRNKALIQRDKLRKSNIAAVFIEQFNVNNKPSYRVRLGPFVNREQTRVAQNKIKAKHDIDGIIMKYER